MKAVHRRSLRNGSPHIVLWLSSVDAQSNVARPSRSGAGINTHGIPGTEVLGYFQSSTMRTKRGSDMRIVDRSKISWHLHQKRR